jgi:hypothetical protein
MQKRKISRKTHIKYLCPTEAFSGILTRTMGNY